MRVILLNSAAVKLHSSTELFFTESNLIDVYSLFFSIRRTTDKSLFTRRPTGVFQILSDSNCLVRSPWVLAIPFLDVDCLPVWRSLSFALHSLLLLSGNKFSISIVFQNVNHLITNLSAHWVKKKKKALIGCCLDSLKFKHWTISQLSQNLNVLMIHLTHWKAYASHCNETQQSLSFNLKTSNWSICSTGLSLSLSEVQILSIYLKFRSRMLK